MNETILYGVLVYPFELDEYLESIVEEEFTFLGDFHLNNKTRVDNIIYHTTYGNEEDFRLLEETLDRVRFPYNYYPRGLDDNFVINRLRKEEADFGTSPCYASFLEHKYFNKHLSLDYVLHVENNWDNQVKLCLEHRVVRILEGE